jgi:hypothetical protein
MTTFMYGVLPGRGIDKDAMRNTLHRVAHPDGCIQLLVGKPPSPGAPR